MVYCHLSRAHDALGIVRCGPAAPTAPFAQVVENVAFLFLNLLLL